jgi:uncharacterized membrane protein YczE
MPTEHGGGRAHAPRVRTLARSTFKDRPAERLVRLFGGLIAFALSMSLMVRANVGLGPWDVLHEGISRHTGIPFGDVTIIVGLVVLLVWIPIGQRPGFGTVANVIVIGLAVDGFLAVIATPTAMPLRVVMCAAGILLNGVATGCYIGAGLGPGPRDGLMTGLAARGHSIRVVRTCIELSVLALGIALGGDFGVGTIAFALLIGPIAHVTIPWFSIDGPANPAGPPMRTAPDTP